MCKCIDHQEADWKRDFFSLLLACLSVCACVHVYIKKKTVVVHHSKKEPCHQLAYFLFFRVCVPQTNSVALSHWWLRYVALWLQMILVVGSVQFWFLIALRVILLRLSQICNNRPHRFELLLWKCELQRVCQKSWVSNSLPLPLDEAFYDWNMNTELLIFLYLNKTMNMSNLCCSVSLSWT